ncbi:hypothetical protein HDF24_17160 [Mucilaginibacter sp. X4EP1]|uniref:hypothetical protein n=1 Tax=Mucilaginibacter sp. X4EP1 TaxID=2723092 RepID=UPI00216A384E|nr:hypothetical protein [Mucilaginibacter sp. X4EP1]MCS3815781.1 low affinity Fe/Cu permease [Mucilaginibacter sp. X4EP1]
MTKKLLRSLFTTSIISIAISTAATCIFYSVLLKNADYGHAVQQIISGVFLLNCILLIMSLPILFLGNAELWNNKPFRLIMYFAGVIFFIITASLLKIGQHDREVYLMTGVIFLLVHAFFYYRLTKKLS